MAVCISFNYPRENLSNNSAGAASSAPGSPMSMTVKMIGNGYIPKPFTSLCVQRFPNGFNLGGSMYPVECMSEVTGNTAGWPRVLKAYSVPGSSGSEAAGFYLVFGQIP
jgi:hypothetical protein